MTRSTRIAEENKEYFKPSGPIQEALGRIAVLADGAHAFGAEQKGKMCGEIADFTSFSFHAVKNLTTAEGGATVWKEIRGISSDHLYKQFMDYSLHGQTKDRPGQNKAGKLGV